MVSRDDTAAMLSLIARWLRGEVTRLAYRAADSGMNMAERGRVVRALLHSLGILAVFFRCAEACISSCVWIAKQGGCRRIVWCPVPSKYVETKHLISVVPCPPPPYPIFFLNLPVRESHACEAGVDHPELESALWASVAAGVKALEHTTKAADFQTLCEGLARLDRIVRSLLHGAACSAGQAQQHLERRVSVRPSGGGG